MSLWAWVAAAGVLATGIIASRPKPRRRKKVAPPPKVEPPAAEPWDNDTVADLGELSTFPIEDQPPVTLEPGGRFWVRIDESKLGPRSATPTIGSIGNEGLPRPPCVMVVEDIRRGQVRHVLVIARPDAAFCQTYLGWELVGGSIDDELGFRMQIEPPVLEVGRRVTQAEGGHVVARPGQRVHLDCLGHLVGQVTVVLPLGEYSCAATSRDGAEALLVELDPRPDSGESVATWVVTRGGHLQLAHAPVDGGEELVVGVVATDPVHRVGRL